MSQSRTNNSIKNLKYGFISQIIQYVLSFCTRTIFILYLSKEFLGINSVISNILFILSIAESGMASSFQVALYKPLSENDTVKVNAILVLFKKVFFFLGLSIFVIGLSILPIIIGIIDIENISNFIFVYILSIISTVISYVSLPFSSIIRADQKGYIETAIDQVSIIFQYGLQILVLVFFKNFIFYIFVQVIMVLIGTLFKVRYSTIHYNTKNDAKFRLEKKTIDDIKFKIFSGFFHHLGFVLNKGTDNLVIATFLSLELAGIYSNYVLVIGILLSIKKMVYGSIHASIGNYVAKESKDLNYIMFKRIHFFSMMFTGFTSIMLFVLINNFFHWWIGDDYIFPQNTVLLIVLVYYIDYQGIRKSTWIYKNVTGLFTKDKYSSLIEGVLNVLLSILLIRQFGINGVLIGTILAFFLTAFWVQPFIVYKFYFERPIKEYFLNHVKYIVVTFLSGGITFFISTLIPNSTFMLFIFKALISAIIAISSLFVLFIKTDEYKYFYKLGLTECKKTLNKLLPKRKRI